jgi:hypothetical protein
MHKLIFFGASALALSVSAPAFADVNVLGKVDVKKTIDVNETIDVITNVKLDANVKSDPKKFAESSAIANQSNYNNEACSNCAEKKDNILDSAKNNQGIVSLNQSSGNFNNQGSLISVAVDSSDPPGGGGGGGGTPQGKSGFAESLAAADQRNGTPNAIANRDGSYNGPGNRINTVNVLYRDALISGSFNSNTGLAYGNQSTGNMNNQVNVLSLAFALTDSGVAISEADLGQVNANNSIHESSSSNNGYGINKSALTTNSLNGNMGIVGVNQSVGNNANQANIVSIAAVGSGLPVFGGN